MLSDEPAVSKKMFKKKLSSSARARDIILRKPPTFLHIPLSAYPSFLGWMCQVQGLSEYVVAMESRLGAALATEARALGDVQGVGEDRLEFEMLAAESVRAAASAASISDSRRSSLTPWTSTRALASVARASPSLLSIGTTCSLSSCT